LATLSVRGSPRSSIISVLGVAALLTAALAAAELAAARRSAHCLPQQLW